MEFNKKYKWNDKFTLEHIKKHSGKKFTFFTEKKNRKTNG